MLGVTVPIGDSNVQRLQDTFPDITVQVELDLDKAGTALVDVDAFVGRARHVQLLTDSPNLRWVQTLTAGSDRVSFDDLQGRNIVLTNGSGIHATNLAEHQLGLMLAFARGLPTLILSQQRCEWTQAIQQFELDGQTLCVVGLGDIGLALAERAACMGMRVTGVRRRQLGVPDFVSAVASLDDMDSLLAEADHIAICLPLTPRTSGIFDAERLARLKQSAHIYNIGRGEIIDQDALIAALESGMLAGAGLDVMSPEPLPSDHPLWRIPNVIITCHTGGRSPRRMDRFMDLLIDNIKRYRADHPLRNIVDPIEGY